MQNSLNFFNVSDKLEDFTPLTLSSLACFACGCLTV